MQGADAQALRSGPTFRKVVLEKTGRPRGDVVSDVERYFVMPGQALAYKIGMREILELRASAQEKLGSRFDLRELHTSCWRTVRCRWASSKLRSTLGSRGKCRTRNVDCEFL